MRLTALACAVLFSVACFAAEPIIGASISANGAETPIPDGAVIETNRTPSDIRLENGAALHFAPRSSGIIFSNRAILDRGSANLTKSAGYAIEAGSFRIEPETPATRATIRIEGSAIEIASVGGDLRIMDGRGALLTRVSSGAHASFQESGASTSAPKRRHFPGTWALVIVAIAAAALAVGLTAAAQGKSL